VTKRRVLALSQDIDVLRRIIAALERAGADVDGVVSVDSIVAAEIPHRYVFVSTSIGPQQIKAMRSKLRAKAHVCVITANAGLMDLTGFLTDDRFNHVIVGDDFDDSIYITASKLLTGDIFGIEKYLPDNTAVHYVRLRDFAGRSEAIATIVAFAESQKVRRQVRGAIASVCEELLMNALYDAPVDDHGHQVFADIDPHDRTKVLSPRPVSIRYAATEDQFVVAVRDRFGRLAKNTIISYIEKCVMSPNQIDRKTYGAGLGLYMVANAAASYIVNVAFGVATEVVCSFDRGAKTPLRLVGMFVHPGNAEMLARGPIAQGRSEEPRGG
jgi:hypothetical protein